VNFKVISSPLEVRTLIAPDEEIFLEISEKAEKGDRLKRRQFHRKDNINSSFFGKRIGLKYNED